MRVGLDTFTIRDLNLTPSQTLDWLAERDFAGAQWGQLTSLSKTLDLGELRSIRDQADALGLYSDISVPTCNPHLVDGDLQEHRSAMIRQIERAAACGWYELHASLGGGNERYMDAVAWTQQLADAAELLRSLAPCLRETACRINLETHGDVTTFELIRLIEDVGPDVVGICLDTANLLCHCEDPVLAARRAAPYVHLTHIKDAMIQLTPTGFRRQTLPPGQGIIDWTTLLPILAAEEPNLPLSIEDHKWLFEFHVFDPHWQRLHPDLTVAEFARVMQLAFACEQRLAEGTLPDPETYEPIPYLDQHEQRLAEGRQYLADLIARLGLEDRPDRPRHYQSLSILPSST